MATKQLRLTVWKPLALDRRIARDGEAPEWPLTPGRDMFIEAYRWQVDLDVWGSADQSVVGALQEALVVRFDPFRPSVERRFDKLRETLDLYKEILNGGGTTWRDCEQVIVGSGEDDDSLQFRADTVRALWHHLRWIYGTFHSLPLATISVR